MATNVRIQPASYDKLKQLARRSGTTMPEILAAAIEEFYRKRFLDECNAAYDRLKEDKKAWRGELKQREAWEATLGDGLEDA